MHHGLAEIAQAAHLLNPALETQGGVTFRVVGLPESAWREWTKQIWEPTLAPTFWRALRFAREKGVRELGALDRELAGKLPSEMAQSSGAAGRRLMQAAPALRGDKSLEKFSRLIESGEVTGQLVCVHALRAAAFHVADPLAVGAYLYQEAMGGLFPKHPALLGTCVESALSVSSAEPSEFLRVA